MSPQERLDELQPFFRIHASENWRKQIAARYPMLAAQQTYQ